MLGWKLFARAVKLLVENLGDALRVSAVPYLAVIVATVALSGGSATTVVESADGSPVAAMPIGPWTLPLLLLNLVVTLWVAVAWHRYVLLEERPEGWVPSLRMTEMLAYLWRSILIGLLVALAIFGILVPLGALALAMPPLAPFVPLVSIFLGALVFYRLGVSLPAMAVGRSMSLGEAMEATRGRTDVVAVLAGVTIVFTLLLQVPTILDGGGGPVTAVYQGVIGWISLMVGASTLTALYGVVVEGRPVE